MTIINLTPDTNGFRNIESQSHRTTVWMEGYIEVPAHLTDKAMTSGGYCDLVLSQQEVSRTVPGEPMDIPITDDEGNILEYQTGYKMQLITETVTVLTDIIPTDPPIDMDTLRAATISSLSASAHAAITHGVDVDTSQGTEHYGLTTEDQINIQNLSLQAATQPGLRIPYHADGGLCRMYSPEEINAVARAAISHVTYHTTYHNHLKVWANRTQDPEELQGIHYGAALPEDLQQSMDALLAEMVEQEVSDNA